MEAKWAMASIVMLSVDCRGVYHVYSPDRLYPPYHVWGLPHANWLATSQFVMPRSYLKSCQVVAKHVPELLQTPKVSHLELEARLSL